MFAIRFMIFACFLLSVPVSSVLAQADSSWSAKDAWYHVPQESGVTPWEWEKAPSYLVVFDKQDAAMERLETNSFVAITPQEAEDLAGQAIDAPAGKAFFLVRGIALNEGTGSFTVYARDRNVWVYHGSLGTHPVAMKRQALIAALPEVPEEVFVTCAMDQ